MLFECVIHPDSVQAYKFPDVRPTTRELQWNLDNSKSKGAEKKFEISKTSNYIYSLKGKREKKIKIKTLDTNFNKYCYFFLHKLKVFTS